MNINDELNKLKEYQNIFGGYTSVSLENIQMAPYLFVDYLDKADILINQDEIKIYLKRRNGIRPWLQRIFRKKIINHNLNLLAKYIYYWVPKTKIMPKINFYWGEMPKNE